jgi:hypothetical protein
MQKGAKSEAGDRGRQLRSLFTQRQQFSGRGRGFLPCAGGG